MICTDKEWKHCRVEKMGCKGCYYDDYELKTQKALCRLHTEIDVLDNSIKKAKYEKEYAETIDVEEYEELKQAMETVLEYVTGLEKQLSIFFNINNTKCNK